MEVRDSHRRREHDAFNLSGRDGDERLSNGSDPRHGDVGAYRFKPADTVPNVRILCRGEGHDRGARNSGRNIALFPQEEMRESCA